jgi:exopolysaccharide production protein ExoZ
MRIRLKLIQVIRGIAAMIVVFHHVTASTSVYFKTDWLCNIFRVGWNGVDIFFVLSGFIITFIHFEDVVNRRNIKQFFIKRFNRVYPIFWIVNIGAIALLLAEKKYVIHDLFSLFIAKTFLLIPTSTELLPVRVSWSLWFEVLFYLVFGLCIALGIRLSKMIWMAWLTLIITYYVFVERVSPPLICNPFILEFLMGCVIGYIFKLITMENAKFLWLQNKRKALLAVGVILFLSMWAISYLTPYGQKFLIESRIMYGISASFIILGAALIDYHKSVKIPRILLLAGDASYVIYLTHVFILAFIFKLLSSIFKHLHSSGPVFIIGLFAALLAIACGILFHIFVEKPLLKKVNSLTLKKE